MSGRIYDQSGKATCKLCGSDCYLSYDRNFNGPKCKNIECGNINLMEIEYDESVKHLGIFTEEIRKLIKNKNK